LEAIAIAERSSRPVRTRKSGSVPRRSVRAPTWPAECARYHPCISRYVRNQSSVARPSQWLMITLCAGHMGERRPPPWPHGSSPLACRAHGSLPRGEFFGTYLAQLPDLAPLRPLAAAGQTGRSRILAGHRVSCCWRQAGLCGRAGCTGGVRHRSPTSLGPVRAPGLTCGFWWQVQDSNLGRLSSAILQVSPIPRLTCGFVYPSWTSPAILRALLAAALMIRKLRDRGQLGLQGAASLAGQAHLGQQAPALG
jgi:hypothetical protein